MNNQSIFLLIFLFFFACKKQDSAKKEVKTNTFYDKAFEYRESKKTDSAFLYFNNAKELFLQQNDSLGAGKCLLNMAIISTDKGDYFGGLELSLNAISYFNEKNKDQFVYIKSNFNNLGITSYNLKDYDNSLKFYDLALHFSQDSLDTRVYLNNKAKTYQAVKKYKEALIISEQLLKKSSKNQIEYARALTNVATTKWLQNPSYNPLPSFFKALKIREEEHDVLGQNSSYAHLTEYYLHTSRDSALFYAKKMYQAAREINTPDDMLEALQNLIKLSPHEESKEYFSIYKNLEDSVQTVRNLAKNQFALIRYEAEKNKAENASLQEDITSKKYQIALLIFGIFLIVIIAILWYKKRKQKLKSDAQNAIKESELKTSKKVHDVVANGLYRMMVEIDNQQELDKENILDKIEVLYEKSRDISYEPAENKLIPFQEKISELLRSFATDETKILIVGNSENLWAKVNVACKHEIEHILQEIMVNMRKHSKASQVLIKLEQKNNQIHITYTDNGIGLKEGTTFNNGLRNTGNRINTINGAITFDREMDKGLKILISFPFS